jgi:hypothetical protein
MLASIVSSSDGTGFAAPEGWTVVRDDIVPGALRQTIYRKVAGPAEPDSYTWTLPWRGRVAGGLTTYAGVDPLNPIDAQAAAVRPFAGPQVRTPSITTTQPGAELIHFAAVNAEGTVVPPPDMVQRWLAVSPGGDTRDVLAVSFDTNLTLPGPTGSRALPVTEPGARIGALLALRPAP